MSEKLQLLPEGFQYPILAKKEQQPNYEELAAALFKMGRMQIHEGGQTAEVRCEEIKSPKGDLAFSVQYGRVVENRDGQSYFGNICGCIASTPHAAIYGLRPQTRSLIYDQVNTKMRSRE